MTAVILVSVDHPPSPPPSPSPSGVAKPGGATAAGAAVVLVVEVDVELVVVVGAAVVVVVVRGRVVVVVVRGRVVVVVRGGAVVVVVGGSVDVVVGASVVVVVDSWASAGAPAERDDRQRRHQAGREERPQEGGSAMSRRRAHEGRAFDGGPPTVHSPADGSSPYRWSGSPPGHGGPAQRWWTGQE